MTVVIQPPKTLAVSCAQFLNDCTRMKAIFFLIILSLIVAAGFLIAFIWAVRSGQYDDDYTPSVRMLFDDNKEEANEKQ